LHLHDILEAKSIYKKGRQ